MKNFLKNIGAAWGFISMAIAIAFGVWYYYYWPQAWDLDGLPNTDPVGFIGTLVIFVMLYFLRGFLLKILDRD